MRRFLSGLCLLALLSWQWPAHAAGTPESLIDAFLQANRQDDVETMLVLALPRHEGAIRSPRWREFWKGFTVTRYLDTRLAPAQGLRQEAEVHVMLEYSDELLAKVRAHYETLPPGQTRELTRQTLERRGRRVVAIRVLRLGEDWYWDHE